MTPPTPSRIRSAAVRHFFIDVGRGERGVGAFRRIARLPARGTPRGRRHPPSARGTRAHQADPDRAHAGAPLGSAKAYALARKKRYKSEGRALRLAMRRVYDANLCDAVRIRSFASCVAITP